MTSAATSALVTPRGVVAFNVITLEHAEGILDGAQQAGEPVILQVSENAIRYHGGRGLPLLRGCAALIEEHPATASLHLDHLVDPALLDLARTDVGVSSAMFDASALPDEENVARTATVAADLHARGLWVEAELGAIGGKGGAHTPGVRTVPSEAASYVSATGVDALAVAVGSEHAMTTRSARLDMELIAAIKAHVAVPLVLHGSSGVPVEQLREAIAAGISKINVGTALNVAFTGRVRELLAGDATLTDPRKYLGPARERVAATVGELLSALLST